MRQEIAQNEAKLSELEGLIKHAGKADKDKDGVVLDGTGLDKCLTKCMSKEKDTATQRLTHLQTCVVEAESKRTRCEKKLVEHREALSGITPTHTLTPPQYTLSCILSYTLSHIHSYTHSYPLFPTHSHTLSLILSPLLSHPLSRTHLLTHPSSPTLSPLQVASERLRDKGLTSASLQTFPCPVCREALLAAGGEGRCESYPINTSCQHTLSTDIKYTQSHAPLNASSQPPLSVSN